ncbi:MAG: undecaprenyl-diphosphatase UppP [Caldilinea sp.]|nr:undecaprenyl-diphosphatase UppP [Caldilinea sp.]MCB9116850.1 undecaprenyl-diphosphatase UppP [Caldilineaceae bacterium]MCB9120019.1 undecaprenyl-diphosphatase UppP [Caldilineaceae bacterium]MCB9125786.1 undecaprenyl-diphosphatase UppP [Caldilineaceae bacterium]MCO5211358.1 undecaprenyl-diphosphatase UppP [Caldilinea sp.]
MDIIQAIILGIVQGATEFIPVSSSGHLVIVPWLLGWDKPSLLFDTMLHWGTLVAIFVVFWRDFLALIRAWFTSLARRSLADPNARLAWFIIVGTIPAVVAGLLFDDFLESMFLNPQAVGFFMLITAGLLAGSEQLAKRSQATRDLEHMNWTDAIVIGVAQSFALLPGISRSGSTIAAGLGRGIRRDLAARFSFLLGTPAFFGAGLLQVAKAMGDDSAALAGNVAPMLAGFIAAAVVGVLAIRFLLRYLRNRTLYVFSVYCLVVGLLTITLSFVR